MSDWKRATARMLGKQVRVTLAGANAETGEAAVIAEGKFIAFGEGGDLVVQDEMGFAHYCWPLLDIEEVT